MSSMRRVSIVEGMFWDIASREEKAKVDELYERGFKASAIVFMLKRVREKWVELINKEEEANKPQQTIPGFQRLVI